MKSASATTTVIVTLVAVMLMADACAAAAQTLPKTSDIPQSLRVEHENTLGRLNAASRSIPG